MEGRWRGWEWGMTLGPRMASSSLSACWGRACKQTRCSRLCPAPLPSRGLERIISSSPSGGCSRNLLAQGSRWGYSGCLVEELRSIWRI